jgi:hypothetical protein
MAVLEKTADQLKAQFVILSVRQTVYTLLGSRMRENPGVRVEAVFGLRMLWGCAAPRHVALLIWQGALVSVSGAGHACTTNLRPGFANG